MEAGRFDLAWGGIAGLSVALPVIYTECIRRGFGIGEIARWMSSAPAALAGIGAKAGALEAGRDANFVVFDTAASFYGDCRRSCTFGMRFRLMSARRCEVS